MTRKPTSSLSIVIDLVDEIDRTIHSRPELGYASVTDFARDAMRERLMEIYGEIVHIAIDRDTYDEINEMIRETRTPYLSASRMMHEFLRSQLRSYKEQKLRETR